MSAGLEAILKKIEQQPSNEVLLNRFLVLISEMEDTELKSGYLLRVANAVVTVEARTALTVGTELIKNESYLLANPEAAHSLIQTLLKALRNTGATAKAEMLSIELEKWRRSAGTAGVGRKEIIQRIWKLFGIAFIDPQPEPSYQGGSIPIYPEDESKEKLFTGSSINEVEVEKTGLKKPMPIPPPVEEPSIKISRSPKPEKQKIKPPKREAKPKKERIKIPEKSPRKEQPKPRASEQKVPVAPTPAKKPAAKSKSRLPRFNLKDLPLMRQKTPNSAPQPVQQAQQPQPQPPVRAAQVSVSYRAEDVRKIEVVILADLVNLYRSFHMSEAEENLFRGIRKDMRSEIEIFLKTLRNKNPYQSLIQNEAPTGLEFSTLLSEDSFWHQINAYFTAPETGLRYDERQLTKKSQSDGWFEATGSHQGLVNFLNQWVPEKVSMRKEFLGEVWGKLSYSSVRGLLVACHEGRNFYRFWGDYLDLLIEQNQPRTILLKVRKSSLEEENLIWALISWPRLIQAWHMLGLEGFAWKPEEGVGLFIRRLKTREMPSLPAMMI